MQCSGYAKGTRVTPVFSDLGVLNIHQFMHLTLKYRVNKKNVAILCMQNCLTGTQTQKGHPEEWP